MSLFDTQMERGKVGEAIVKRYFEQQGVELRDTRDDEEFWKEDVDFVMADGLKYEVKTDYRFADTGNLAIEYGITNFYGYKDSWLTTSKADYFCFVNPFQPDRFACISAEDLRHLCETENFRKALCRDYQREVHLYLLPFKDYEDAFSIYYLDD